MVLNPFFLNLVTALDVKYNFNSPFEKVIKDPDSLSSLNYEV